MDMVYLSKYVVNAQLHTVGAAQAKLHQGSSPSQLDLYILMLRLLFLWVRNLFFAKVKLL